MLPKSNAAIDPQCAARRRMALADRQFRLFHIHQDAGAALIKGIPLFRGGKLPRGSVQQPHTQTIFQSPDLFADGRRGQFQRPRGTGKAALFHNLGEDRHFSGSIHSLFHFRPCYSLLVMYRENLRDIYS